MSFLSANFMLQRCCIKHYRKCFCPTCASSFPIAEFCNYIQTVVSILFLKLYYIGWVLLNWGTGAYIQGSFLSTCLSTICSVWKLIFKNHHPPHNTERWLYCCVHVCETHCITWQTNSVWKWDNYLQNQLENIVLCMMSSCIIMQLCVS